MWCKCGDVTPRNPPLTNPAQSTVWIATSTKTARNGALNRCFPLNKYARECKNTLDPCLRRCRGTSLISTPPNPLGPPYGPGHMLLQAPSGKVCFMSEVPLQVLFEQDGQFQGSKCQQSTWSNNENNHGENAMIEVFSGRAQLNVCPTKAGIVTCSHTKKEYKTNLGL